MSELKKNGHYKPVTWVISAILIIVGLIFMVPFAYLVFNSFKGTTEYIMKPFKLPDFPLDWKTYKVMLSNFKILKYFKNTAIVAVISEIIIIPISICTAFTFAKIKFRGSNLIYLLMVAAMTIPAQVTAIPVYIYFGKFGLINEYLGLIIWNLTLICGCTVMMTSFFKLIPNELLDSAKVDGCGYFGTVLHVVMPVGKPTIIIQIILNLTSIWNELFMAKIVLQKSSMRTVMVALTMLEDQYAEYPTYSFAGMVLAAIPTIVLFFVFQKYIIKDAMGGAVKG